MVAAEVTQALWGAVLASYHWLAAHPYVAVIGGMCLYLAVLLSATRWTCITTPLQQETLRSNYELLQRLAHVRRVRAWEARNPDQARHQQQQHHHQQAGHRDLGDAAKKWGGSMGFGPQRLPDGHAQLCEGAVREVLEAMDFFEVLGVPWGTASGAALRAARRARALAVHPDKVGRDTPGAALAGSRVNQAYTTLSDPNTRLLYDAWLAKQS